MSTTTVIDDGAIKQSDTSLAGIHGVRLDFQGGSAGGLSDNLKVKLEVPLKLKGRQFFVGPGFPMVAQLRPKFIVETAFSAKNSTFSGKGEWAFKTDSVAAIGGKVASELGLTTVKSIIDSLDGISIGVSGIVVAVQVQVRYAAGVDMFSFGPYVGLTFAYGLTRGTSIDLVVCKGGTFDITLVSGISGEMDNVKITELMKNKFGAAPKLVATLLEVKAPIYHGEDVEPDVPLCKEMAG